MTTVSQDYLPWNTPIVNWIASSPVSSSERSLIPVRPSLAFDLDRFGDRSEVSAGKCRGVAQLVARVVRDAEVNIAARTL